MIHEFISQDFMRTIEGCEAALNKLNDMQEDLKPLGKIISSINFSPDGVMTVSERADNMSCFERIMSGVKRGGHPATIGCMLTVQQAEEIKSFLDFAKPFAEDYYNQSILTRVCRNPKPKENPLPNGTERLRHGY